MMKYSGHNLISKEFKNFLLWECDCSFKVYFFKNRNMAIIDNPYHVCIYVKNECDFEKIKEFDIPKIGHLLVRINFNTHDHEYLKIYRMMEE